MNHHSEIRMVEGSDKQVDITYIAVELNSAFQIQSIKGSDY
jgi:hypothetical protein